MLDLDRLEHIEKNRRVMVPGDRAEQSAAQGDTPAEQRSHARVAVRVQDQLHATNAMERSIDFVLSGEGADRSRQLEMEPAFFSS